MKIRDGREIRRGDTIWFDPDVDSLMGPPLEPSRAVTAGSMPDLVKGRAVDLDDATEVITVELAGVRFPLLSIDVLDMEPAGGARIG